jgi:hypothetical protein
VPDSPDEQAGPPRPDLADEIGKLVGAAQEWARRALPESAIGHGGPDCQWCPICQFANILRGESPEVAERIAEAGTAIAAALKAVTDAAVAKAQGGETAKRSRPMPPPRVQRIDLDDPREP